MPKTAEYKAVEFDGFTGGLNKKAASSRLQPTEVTTLLNMRVGARGELLLRNGYTKHDANLVEDSEFIFPWRTGPGVDHLIVVDALGDIWQDTTDGTFTDSSHTTNPSNTLAAFGVGFASAGAKAYLTSKTFTGNPVSFDGTTWATVASFPKAKHLLFRTNRMFAINTTAAPSAIQISDLGDPETFTDTIDDLDPDDGYEVNAVTGYGDDMILFKDRSVWKLSGKTPVSFGLYKVDNVRGSVSPRALAEIRGQLIFFDRNTGIWAFDGANFELLSDPINDYLQAGIDYTNAWQASAYVGDDRYYLSVPWAAGGWRTFVFHADVKAWSEYDTGFLGSASYLDERYLGLVGSDGVYKADPASQLVAPSATPIAGSFRTGWFTFAGPGAKARVRRLEMTVRGLATTSFVVNMYRDFDPDTVYITRTFTAGAISYTTGTPSATEQERRITSDGWGNRIHAFQFEVTTSDDPFEFNDMSVFFTGAVDVRGER